MNARILAARAPFVAALAVVLAILLARSSLTVLLPFGIGGAVWLWLVLALALALAPALFARDTPLPAASLVVVPALVVASYGASRLDWLRVLKDFGVAEPDAVDFARLGLAAVAVALLWGLHAADLATRFKVRAVERGIERAQADAASGRTLLANARAAGIAFAGAAGLLVVAIVGVRVGDALPTERGAFVVPLLAAALLIGAAFYLARAERAS